MLPSPMSVMTAHYSAAILYTPHHASEPGTGSTVSGFELETIDEDDQDLMSKSTMTRRTPASSQASSHSDLEDKVRSNPELQRYLDAMATRIEQLAEENELLAE